MYKLVFKPLIDILVAFIVITITLPLLLIVLVLLSIANKGTPVFLQRRPGLKNKIFTLVKFKTMNDNKDAEGNLLPDGERITLIGNIIRKTSLDELPQLINVLKGDMSLVGPRPLLPQYLDLYTERQARRHEVKPGITGWAQVNGRNSIDWEQKFELDVWYVENISFLLDLKILFKTVWNVLFSKGISNTGHATMPFFEGNKE